MDLQRDFLDLKEGRLPVNGPGAEAVLRVANALLSKRVLPEALPIMVLNQFSATARIGNFFRKGAAMAGSVGAQLDPRLIQHGAAKIIFKARPSAFSNAELDTYLQRHGIQTLYVLGVFAEGCVRATVLDAIKRGYSVHVLTDAVASNGPWKKRFALWSMQRAGAKLSLL